MNGSRPAKDTPEECYDPIKPGFIAEAHGKDKRASTATSERQFAGKTAREAQNVGSSLSRRQHQEIRNAGTVFKDEQEPGGRKAGRAFKRSQRPQCPSRLTQHHLRGISRRHRASVSAVEVEAVNRRNHGKPHSASLGTEFRENGCRTEPQGTASVPEREGGRRSPAASWRICAGICAPSSSWRWRKAIPTATRRRRFIPRRRGETAEARVHEQRGGGTLYQALDKRERVIAHLALFAGMRPGEILALQRRHISAALRKLTIEQRLYRGDIDTPKTIPPPAPSPFPQDSPPAFGNGWSWWEDNPTHGYSLRRIRKAHVEG
jgi:hypothetical protein